MKPVMGGSIKPFCHDMKQLGGQRFVFTSAQNNTKAHKGFLKTLERFCKYNQAQLVIAPFIYNKNGFQNGENEDTWYDPALTRYFLGERAQVCNGLVWCGELNILPTAVNPLSGLDSYTRSSSGIIPHAKISMKSIATPKAEPAKFLYTTGAVTQRNYIPQKSGQKAEFHHAFGALYVEVDRDGRWFARQLNAEDSGAFYDLTTYYTPKTVYRDMRVEAINWGDIHAEKMDGLINEGSWFGEDSMLNTLKPRYQFIHDLSDFEPRNHHNIKNPHFLAKQHFHGINNVERALGKASDFLRQIEREKCITVVVESNHDQAYLRWLSEADVRKDPENARFYHESNARVYKAIEDGDEDFSVFEWAMRRGGDLDKTVFLTENDSFVICEEHGGIECAMHGHRGPNGSRGSPNAYRGIGRRANTGHTHSAGIIDGIYTAGVSASMEMGYNIGLSSWSHSHIITYSNGKRCIVTMIDGKYRV